MKKFPGPLLIIHFVVFLFVTTGYSKNYYVDASQGNDNNNGLSPTAAWKTIKNINNFLFNSTDTISFKCGERYTGYTLNPNRDSLTFNSYGNGNRPILDGLGKRNCLDMSNKSNINIENIKFVHGFPRDIALDNDRYVKIINCNIDSCAGTGIYDQNIYTGQGYNLTIRNSTISYAGASTGGGHGIYIDGTNNTLLDHDTLLSNKNDNIRIAYGYTYPYYSDSLTIRYCVIKYAGDENISDDGSRYSKFYYNVFENDLNTWSENISLFKSNGYCAGNNQYFNNTIIIHDPDNQDNAGFFINTSSGITNMQVYNNIFFIADSMKGWAFFGQIAPSGNWRINHNLYYSINNKENHIWHWENSTLASFAQWQSKGFDTNGVYGNPLFTSLDSLTLQDKSPAINIGQANSIAKDINNNPVPSPPGTLPDAGAFENTVSYGIKDPVPVEITNINIYESTNSIIVSWETATETNNKGFEIERKLKNNWTAIGYVEGKGNSTDKVNYRFIDDFGKFYYKGKVEYRIKQIDLDGTVRYSKVIELNVDFSIKTFFLYQNYPNPYNPVTTISYQIPLGCFVSLKVYDVLGRLVRTLVNGYKQQGKYSINFSSEAELDAGGVESSLASGIYFFRLHAGNFISTKKMLLLR